MHFFGGHSLSATATAAGGVEENRWLLQTDYGHTFHLKKKFENRFINKKVIAVSIRGKKKPKTPSKFDVELYPLEVFLYKTKKGSKIIIFWRFFF